jgi:hypothetical protein
VGAGRTHDEAEGVEEGVLAGPRPAAIENISREDDQVRLGLCTQPPRANEVRRA